MLGIPDDQQVHMADVQRRARELAPTDAPTVPSGVTLDLLGEDDDEDDGGIGAVEKAATPAELAVDEKKLQINMARARPMALVPQRDSDAQQCRSR